MSWPSASAFMPMPQLSLERGWYPTFVSCLSITGPYQSHTKIIPRSDLKLNHMWNWNNCLPHKHEFLLLHSSAYSKSLPSLLNDTEKKPRSCPPLSHASKFFKQRKRKRGLLNPRFPIPHQRAIYLFMCISFLCTQENIYKKKTAFQGLSENIHWHVWRLTSVTDTICVSPPHSTLSYLCKYSALIQTTIVVKSISVEQRWGNKAKFTAAARHRLPAASLNKENSDTGNKGKPFYESLLYWNRAQQMQFKRKGNFCCRL